MIYSKLFQLSGLRKTDINTKLGLMNNERQRYERSTKIDLTTIKELVSKHSINQKEVF